MIIKMKVGFITSGGDCQSLNAAMRGVAKTLYRNDKNTEIIGILDGYKGLIYGNSKKMKPCDFSGILTLGGTIIGTSRQPFKEMGNPGEGGVDKVAAMKENYKKWGLDCLVILGGNGTQKTANLLSGEGLNVVSLPKTIDNDLWGTDMTFGFHSAVDIATQAIDNIHSTATSHGRVFIVEVMGHKTGWMTLYAGVAGGADIILVPEISYDIKKVAAAINERIKNGNKFSILAVAEGAISKEDAQLKKKELKKKKAAEAYPSVAYELADKLSECVDREIRVAIPGHTQRGGNPNYYDRLLATRFGIKAAELIAKGDYGKMVALEDGKITAVPLSEIAGKLKVLSPDNEIIAQAKEIGICFGD